MIIPIFWVNLECKTIIMADNYIEKQYDEYLARKAAKENAKKAAFRRQLKAYKEKLAREKAAYLGASADEEHQ